MAERFKAPVLKTGVGASPPWVRIPLPPPDCTFVRPSGRIVVAPLISRVISPKAADTIASPAASGEVKVLAVPG